MLFSVGQRKVAPPVVVAVVADHGGELRRLPQFVLPLLGYEGLQLFPALFNVFHAGRIPEKGKSPGEGALSNGRAAMPGRAERQSFTQLVAFVR